MPRGKNPVERIALEAIKRVNSGNRAPSLSSLLRVVIKNKRPANRNEMQRLVANVRRYIEDEYDGLPVCTVGEGYYQEQLDDNGKVVRKSFAEVPPTSEEEAVACLAGGRSPTAGLYFPRGNGKTDRIYMAYVERNFHQSAREETLNVGRIVSGHQYRVLRADQAIRTVRKAKRLVYEEMDERMAERVMKLGEKIQMAQEDFIALHHSLLESAKKKSKSSNK